MDTPTDTQTVIGRVVDSWDLTPADRRTQTGHHPGVELSARAAAIEVLVGSPRIHRRPHRQRPALMTAPLPPPHQRRLTVRLAIAGMDRDPVCDRDRLLVVYPAGFAGGRLTVHDVGEQVIVVCSHPEERT